MLTTGSGKLSFATKTLRAEWERARADWHDQVRDDFETQHLELIETEVSQTLNAINALAQILVKAEQACA